MMASKNLVEFAVEKGLYNPETDGAFNFSKAYTRDDDRDRTLQRPARLGDAEAPQSVARPGPGRRPQRSRCYLAPGNARCTVEDAKAHDARPF